MAYGKMRVLYWTKNAKMVKLADTLCKMFDIKGEPIPPAYNPEKEKLVFIGISCGKEAPDVLRRFLREMSKDRAQNVAFFFDAPKIAAEELIKQVKDAGAAVPEDIFYYTPGLTLPFLSTVKPEDMERFKKWAENIVASVHS